MTIKVRNGDVEFNAIAEVVGYLNSTAKNSKNESNLI